MSFLGSKRILAAAVVAAGAMAAGAASAQEVVFLSTQLRPIEEAQKLRDVILKEFKTPVRFVADEPGPFTTRIKAEAQANKFTSSALGALHGELPPVLDALQPVDDLAQKLADRNFPKAFLDLGKLGTGKQMYIPWMQATYIMVAHKQALPHLPQGADVNALTYDQLKDWAANIQKATGERRLGFPAGPKGLMHRFFQGYLLPSYTGSAVSKFKSPEAEKMWTSFKELWAHVHPRSTSYEFMQEPLLAGEVWVAWDHSARLLDALRQRPDDFVAFPAPAGPAGRGFMPVVAGLAITKGAPQRAEAAALIEYLTRPDVAAKTVREVGFYPVANVQLPADLPAGIRLAGEAIAKQSASKDALPSLLPVGLGDKGGEFNKVFLDTFQRIVVRGQNVRESLDREGETLKGIMSTTGAPCWAPDPPSSGACPVL